MKNNMPPTKQAQHTPERYAQIAKNIKSNGVYFKYANGTPGDLIIDIRKDEGPAWDEIVNKLNTYAALLASHRELIAIAKDTLIGKTPDLAHIFEVLANAERVGKGDL